MCGIVGVLGRSAVAMQVVDALKRLEYRGYDSAGVATLENGRLERRRAEGKLRNLELKLSHAPLIGAIGIGHTRWATHGRPNETNAHPHATDKLAVVHNGIIENYRELKAGPEANGGGFEQGPAPEDGPRGQGRGVRDRDRHRGRRSACHRRAEPGPHATRGGRHDAAPPARRL